MYRIYIILLVLCISSCRYIYIEFNDDEVLADNVNLELDIGINTNLVDRKLNYERLISSISERMDLRLIIEIYSMDDYTSSYTAKKLFRRMEYFRDIDFNNSITIDSIALPYGKYKILLWADYVSKEGHKNIYYETSSLCSVRKVYGGISSGFNIMRDAFSSVIEVDVSKQIGDISEKNCKAETVLVRPFAIYGIISTDAAECTKEVYCSKISYNMYFPVAYNVYYNLPESYEVGIFYESMTHKLDENEVFVASDIVFTGNDPTFYYVNIETYDTDKMPINAVGGKKISLQKNSLTILKGDFLIEKSSGGGIGINPNFDDEIFIPVL